MLLAPRSMIEPEICQRLEWFERVVPLDLVLRQVNSIPCTVCRLGHPMPLEIRSLETAWDIFHRLPPPVWRLQALHLQTVSSMFTISFQCRIFRNESEAKDDHHVPTTPARVQNVVAPNDEVADAGYYTFPPMNDVASTFSAKLYRRSQRPRNTIF